MQGGLAMCKLTTMTHIMVITGQRRVQILNPSAHFELVTSVVGILLTMRS